MWCRSLSEWGVKTLTLTSWVKSSFSSPGSCAPTPGRTPHWTASAQYLSHSCMNSGGTSATATRINGPSLTYSTLYSSSCAAPENIEMKKKHCFIPLPARGRSIFLLEPVVFAPLKHHCHHSANPPPLSSPSTIRRTQYTVIPSAMDALATDTPVMCAASSPGWNTSGPTAPCPTSWYTPSRWGRDGATSPAHHSLRQSTPPVTTLVKNLAFSLVKYLLDTSVRTTPWISSSGTLCGHHTPHREVAQQINDVLPPRHIMTFHSG